MVPGYMIKSTPESCDSIRLSGATTGDAGISGEERRTEEEQAQAAYTQIEPRELAFASAKASFMMHYMAWRVESSGIDPAIADEETLAQLMHQYAPLAADEADQWFASIDHPRSCSMRILRGMIAPISGSAPTRRSVETRPTPSSSTSASSATVEMRSAHRVPIGFQIS